MGGETTPIAKMAEKISEEIFRWFKWERVDLMDQNFDCVKVPKHAPKKEEHTHPVDVVFHYVDPYLNKRVLLNTDLKAYAKASISINAVRKALQSLGRTIECARSSADWRARYNLFEEASDIRGMLFVYNHDNEYDKKFYDLFQSTGVAFDGKDIEKGAIHTENLPIEQDQIVHIVEPTLINYMTTVIADANRLHTDGSFPETEYYFYYPDLRLHKAHGSKESRAATIESIAGPFLIIEHAAVKKYNEKTGIAEERFGPGYVIYYNRSGSNHREFMYLFDTLSKYQILDGDHSIRVRVGHSSPDQNLRSHFNRAITAYAADWGFDEYKIQRLKAIKLTVLEIQKTTFSKTDIGWEQREDR